MQTIYFNMETLKLRSDEKFIVCGFKNSLATYGRAKDAKTGKVCYRIYLAPDLNLLDFDRFSIYRSQRKPLIKNLKLLFWFAALFGSFTFLLLLFVGMFNKYWHGGKQFINAEAYQPDVRFFVWCTIIAKIILYSLLIYSTWLK